MNIPEILKDLVERRASDVFIVAGRPLGYKLHENIFDYDEQILKPADTDRYINEIYDISGRDQSAFRRTGDDDFAFSIKDASRFRVNMYRQRGSSAAVIRIIAFTLPQPAELNIPQTVINLCGAQKGLVLVTGSSGSGKSTTLACMIDSINTLRREHIITLEDPIEFLHPHKKSIVSQREISLDSQSYHTALRAVLRQSPNVLLLGEMRDTETIETAMTASETGHLVISSLHTVGAASSVDRIIDAFPAEKQRQARLQLSMVLNAVVSQQLLPTVDGGVVPAFEIMICNNAIRNMIRESKTHMLDSAIASGSEEGMISMDSSLLQLCEKGVISRDSAAAHSMSPEGLLKRLPVKK